jgi:hypothetical protein
MSTPRTSKNCYMTYNKPEKKPRKPLRTTKEMAEEFGVSFLILRSKMASCGSPPGVYHHTSRATSNVYHDPDVLRQWWRSINEPR